MALSLLAAWSALLGYLGFAFSWWQRTLARLSERAGDWIVALLLAPYLLATRLRPPPLDLLRMVVYLALPTLCLRARSRDAKPLDVWHVLAILAIWAPIELSLFGLLFDLILPGVDVRGALAGFYLVPGARATLVPGLELPIDKLTAVLLALTLFQVRHPLGQVGFSFRLRWGDLRAALLGLAGFAVVGLPLGVWIGFLRYNPALPRWQEVIVGIVGGYVLVALPEELLFRGIIQNLAARRAKNGWVALLAASAVFGLAHLNNTTRGYAVPNWAYVAMATLAGLAYGWVWQRTKKVTASAVTHTLVNLVWGILLQ
jgi:membrane protease YdiL (CAAX protease family)